MAILAKRVNRPLVIGVLAVLMACAPVSNYPNQEIMVETGWLAQRLTDPGLRIVDLRAADKYQTAHIPKSVNLPITQLYENLPVRGMVLPKEKIEPLLGGLGIGDGTTVVAVDETGGSSAGRLFWTLEYYGHRKVRLLNGGFNKWQKERRETTSALPQVSPARFTANPDPTALATKQEVLDSLGKPGVILVDARTASEYIGTDVRSARGGHIPGAMNINWEENLTGGDIPVFKTASKLAALYEAAGVTKDKMVIVYCQTGTRSSNTYFVLRLLGYEKVKNYDGSWEEWGNDPNTSIEK